MPNTCATNPLCGGTPKAQRDAYNIPDTLRGTNLKTVQMVWGPGTFGFRKADLAVFYKEYNVNSDLGDVTYATENSGTPGGDNFMEGTLDVQMITSIGQGVRTIVSNTDANTNTEDGLGFGPALLKFLVNLNAQKGTNFPQVLSISLGSFFYLSCRQLCIKLAETGEYTLNQCEAWLFV